MDPLNEKPRFRLVIQDERKTRPIQLTSYQEPHVAKIIKILSRFPAALDYSLTGLGKTYVASTIGTLSDLQILLISPPTIFSVWSRMESEYNVDIVDKLSYAKIRGRKNKCNHPYLTKDGQGNYQATPHFLTLVDSGILLVFDEMSKLKNQTCQARKAAHALIRAIILRNSRSKVLLLSALPVDKPIHILSLMQMLGIILDSQFWEYDHSANRYTLLGLQEAVNWCYREDQDLTSEIVTKYPPYSKKSMKSLATELYKNIIFSRISSCMKSDNPDDSQLDIMNGYYPIDNNECGSLLQVGQSTLSEAVRFRQDPDGPMIGLGGGIVHQTDTIVSINWGKITIAIELIGRAKLRMMAQVAYTWLISNPNSKGILGVWFISHIRWLAEVFQDFGALTLHGSLSLEERDENIRRFQDSSLDCRIMIINPTVGGMGISLDDRSGNRPRWMLLMPDYRLMDLVQCTGRVHRQSTKSKSETMIRFVYAQSLQDEVKTFSQILKALQRKSQDARAVVSHDSGIILPDSYPIDQQITKLPDLPNLPPLPVKIRDDEQLSSPRLN